MKINLKAEFNGTVIATSAEDIKELDWALDHIKQKCIRDGLK